MSNSMPDPDRAALVLFREVQPFRQIWLWLVILGVTGLMWYALFVQIFLRRPFGTNPAPDPILIVSWLIFGVGFPIAAYLSRLVIEVRTDGLYFRFIPFHLSFHRIPFDEIKYCRVRTYRPIREYGGWGIRWSRQGKAYNVSGNRGVQLELGDGRRILFGSQQPDALFHAINALR